MKLMKMAAVAALMGCAPIVAEAAPVGGTSNYSLTANNVTDGMAVFAAFDTSRGTLGSVSISYSLKFDVSGTLYNFADVPQSDFDVTGTATLFGPTGTMSENPVMLDHIGDSIPPSESWDYARTGLTIDGLFEDYDLWGYNYHPVVNIGYNASAGISATGVSGMLWPANVTGDFTLTYYYDAAEQGAVPEPASWALMIVGFGAVGGALRRRRVSVVFG